MQKKPHILMVLAGENGVIMSCSPCAETAVNPARLKLQAPQYSPVSHSAAQRHLQSHIL